MNRLDALAVLIVLLQASALAPFLFSPVAAAMHSLAAMITTLMSFVIWIIFGLIALLPWLDQRAVETSAKQHAITTG